MAQIPLGVNCAVIYQRAPLAAIQYPVGRFRIDVNKSATALVQKRVTPKSNATRQRVHHGGDQNLAASARGVPVR